MHPLDRFGDAPRNSSLLLNRGVGPLFFHTNQEIPITELSRDIVARTSHEVNDDGPKTFSFSHLDGAQPEGAGVNFAANILTSTTTPRATHEIVTSGGVGLMRIHDLAGSVPVIGHNRVRELLSGEPVSTFAVELPKEKPRNIPLAYICGNSVSSRPDALLALARIDRLGVQVVEPFTEDQKLNRNVCNLQRARAQQQGADTVRQSIAVDLPRLGNLTTEQQMRANGVAQSQRLLMNGSIEAAQVSNGMITSALGMTDTMNDLRGHFAAATDIHTQEDPAAQSQRQPSNTDQQRHSQRSGRPAPEPARTGSRGTQSRARTIDPNTFRQAAHEAHSSDSDSD